MPAVVTLTRLGTDRQASFPVCRRRKPLQLSACALAASFCAVTLSGCESTWHSPTVANTASAHGASRNAHKSSNTASSHALGKGAHHLKEGLAEGANAYTAASSAPRPGLIPLPDPVLLSPQPEFDCDFKTTEPKTEELMKLDYERQCYRHAEMIVRNHLELLQSAVDKMINSFRAERKRP